MGNKYGTIAINIIKLVGKEKNIRHILSLGVLRVHINSFSACLAACYVPLDSMRTSCFSARTMIIIIIIIILILILIIIILILILIIIIIIIIIIVLHDTTRTFS